MRARPILATALVLVAIQFHPGMAAEDPPTELNRATPWSEAVNGLRARLILKRSRVTNGTPIIATYLVLQNVSDVMNPLTVSWSGQRMKFRVVDANGKELPTANLPIDGQTLAGDFDLMLPIRGQLSFDISCHGRGIPGDKAALIDLDSEHGWVIEPGTGPWFLKATLEIPKVKDARRGVTMPWHGSLELPPVEIPLKSEPLDEATLGKRIAELGPLLTHDDYRIAEKAEADLSLIDDPRVISWYVKALDDDRRSVKTSALDRLAQFNSDEALEGIREGMKTQAQDIGDASEAQKPQSAAGVRHYAAAALSRSPHPQAKPLLLTMKDDPNDAVRINVLHALGKMDTPESLEMIRTMTNDRAEMVRDEAKRYLKLRTDKKAADAGEAQP